MFYRVVLSCIILFTSIGLFGQTNLPVSRTIWDAGAPTGWTDGNGGTPAYTSTTACSGSNGGRLDNNNEYYLVYFSGTPDVLTYSTRITAAATSSLLVEESPDGVSYTTINNHTVIPTSCTSYNFNLLSTSRYVRWTYTKVAQNVVLDDVSITPIISPCVAPASQPTNLILSNVTATSIDGAFTGTTADGYLVIQSTSSSLSSNPVNGTTYNAGDALGGGFVVYNGTSTNFSATGLNSLTTYYFFVFAYNNISCTSPPAYNTTSPLTNNETTIAPPLFTADVIVSEYYNASDLRDEWIELVVVNDNIDMRNWTLRDNNSNTDTWQTAITFQNIAFWNNMRGGTIIKIWNRQRSSTDPTIRSIDVNKNDGYIELYAQHATYFSGGDFGSDPAWGGSSLNYANTGDLLQLRDASGNHVHALGHDASPGSSWTSCPSPKVIRSNNMVADESVRVVGNNFANYNGGSTTNNTIVTQGLTNTSGLANDTDNQLLWRTWREPTMAAQTVVGNVCGTNCIDFTWNKMTDPLPTDDVQGYLILRKTALETFSVPVDGTSYATLSSLGDATVVANLDNPTAGATVSYIDNLAELGTNEYRIYAYRYADDNINGNSFDLARGRAYNTTNYVTVTLFSPLPIELLSFTGKSVDKTNLLEWVTTTEINNDYFTLERSSDATHFNELGTIQGAGNSNTMLYYNFTDENPLNGVNYYRLKQTDFDGSFSYSNIVALSNKTTAFSIWNSAETLFIKGENESLTSSLKIYNLLGELVFEKVFEENTSVETSNFSSGIYLVKIQSNENLFTQKVKF